MKNIFIFICITFSVVSYAQDLTCKDFAEGQFKNTSNNSSLNSTIIRKGDKQIETLANGQQQTKIIRWTSDCDYHLYFDKKDVKNDPILKRFNKNGGLSVIVIKIAGNILYYKSEYNNGKQNITEYGTLTKVN